MVPVVLNDDTKVIWCSINCGKVNSVRCTPLFCSHPENANQSDQLETGKKAKVRETSRQVRSKSCS